MEQSVSENTSRGFSVPTWDEPWSDFPSRINVDQAINTSEANSSNTTSGAKSTETTNKYTINLNEEKFVSAPMVFSKHLQTVNSTTTVNEGKCTKKPLFPSKSKPPLQIWETTVHVIDSSKPTIQSNIKFNIETTPIFVQSNYLPEMTSLFSRDTQNTTKSTKRHIESTERSVQYDCVATSLQSTICAQNQNKIATKKAEVKYLSALSASLHRTHSSIRGTAGTIRKSKNTDSVRETLAIVDQINCFMMGNLLNEKRFEVQDSEQRIKRGSSDINRAASALPATAGSVAATDELTAEDEERLSRFVSEARLPIKKRRMSLPPTKQTKSRRKSRRRLNSYPAQKMLSIAEVQEHRNSPSSDKPLVERGLTYLSPQPMEYLYTLQMSPDQSERHLQTQPQNDLETTERFRDFKPRSHQETHSQPQPHLKTSSHPHLQIQTEPHLKTRSLRYLQTHSDPHIKTHSYPHVKTHSHPHIKTYSHPHLQSHSQPEPHLQTHSLSHLRTQYEPHLQTQAEPHLQTYSQPEPHLQTPTEPHLPLSQSRVQNQSASIPSVAMFGISAPIRRPSVAIAADVGCLPLAAPWRWNHPK